MVSKDFPNNQTIGGYSFDAKGAQLTFIATESKDSRTINTIWYYKDGTRNAIVKASDKTAGIEGDLTISNASPYFSSNSKYIFFKLVPPTDSRKPATDAVQVDVWNYQDSVVQYTQLFQKTNPWFFVKEEFTSVMDVAGNQVIRIEQKR